MPAEVTTRREDLGDSRVRLRVEVDPDTVERQVATAARALARDMKMPGFRKGKVPPQVVLQRVGRDAVLDEAVRNGLPRWYERAVSEAGIATVGDPKLDLRELPPKGSPLEFSIEVGVRPPAELGEYRGLEVGRREPEVPDERVDGELERLREAVASLEAVDRPARTGDFVVLDFTGTIEGEPFEGGEARGYLLELGSGRLVEGFEEQLVGAAAGEERTVTVTFPGDYRSEALAGREAVFDVSVKEVKERRLPELDDDFAAETGGYDSLDELRAEIRSSLAAADEASIEREFREAAVDAAVAASKVDVPPELVHAKAHELWHEMEHRLRQQGVDPARYLQATGKDEEGLVEELSPDAERALRRESVLAAVVEAEGIEVSDDDLLAALREAATSPGRREPSEKELRGLLDRARSQGRDDELRRDIAMRKAVDLLAAEARPIPAERAEARERLWTPEKDEPAERGRLWTPGG